jgi:hypothetical protein
MSDELVEYATLGRARPAALREEVERMRERRNRSRADLERRLDEIEVEIIVARRRRERAERDRLARNEAPGPRPAYQVGLAAILCGGAGELIGRDFGDR